MCSRMLMNRSTVFVSRTVSRSKVQPFVLAVRHPETPNPISDWHSLDHSRNKHTVAATLVYCGVRWLIWSLFRQTATAKYTLSQSACPVGWTERPSSHLPIEDWTVIIMTGAPAYVCNRRKQTRSLRLVKCFVPRRR